MMIDMATLTGAARVALGPDLPPFFCHGDTLAEELMAAGRLTHDPLWRMPLHKAYDRMLEVTDTPDAPWYIVRADDKRRARLNCIAHILSMIPYAHVPFTAPELPPRAPRDADTPRRPRYTHFVPEPY